MPQQNFSYAPRPGPVLSSTPTEPRNRARSQSELSQRSDEPNHDCPSPEQNTTRRSQDSEDDFVKACRHKGRWINVGICFGINLHDIFKIGIRADSRNLVVGDDDDDDSDVYNMEVWEKDLILSAYSALLNLIPKLKKILPVEDDADCEYFNKIVNAMNLGCSMARSEVIRRVKENTLRYLGAGRNPVKIDSQIRDKALRGLNSCDFGRLLIPAEDVQDWDADPDRARAVFHAGIKQIWGTDMPVFLYDDYAYNPEDPEEGLFQGPFLVCVLIDILFGANAVDTVNIKREQQPRHKCTREMYDLATISPQNIAYAAVVARFCLSSQRFWSNKDDNFDYNIFYQAIIQRLADHEDPWVDKTLALWNERIFGDQRGKVTIEDVANEGDEKLCQFMCRRAARKAASKAVEPRTPAMPGRASTGDADPEISDRNSDGTQRTPSPPPSEPDQVIDPRLLDTSAPQTPDTPPSQHNTSPLSSASDTDRSSEVPEGIQGLKRKRHTDRPKAKVTRRRKAGRP